MSYFDLIGKELITRRNIDGITKRLALLEQEKKRLELEKQEEFEKLLEKRKRRFNYGSFFMDFTPARYILETKSWVATGPAIKIQFEYLRTEKLRHGRGTITEVVYGYYWPGCGCKMEARLEGVGRYAISFLTPKGIFEEVQTALDGFLGSITKDGGELRCPRCQTCNEELDYLCEGYEEAQKWRTPRTSIVEQGQLTTDYVVVGNEVRRWV
jgi:hypothetical protein